MPQGMNLKQIDRDVGVSFAYLRLTQVAGWDFRP